MDKVNPWSWCCKRNSLSSEGIFMILPLHYFPGWIKRYVWVHFSREGTLEVHLEGDSLVKSPKYLIVISFQGGIFRPNRPVFKLMILYGSNTLQLTQEKEKSSAAQCSTRWFKKDFSECWNSLASIQFNSGRLAEIPHSVYTVLTIHWTMRYS